MRTPILSLLLAASAALPAAAFPDMPTDRVIVRVRADGAAAKRTFPSEELAAVAGRELGENLAFHRAMGDGALVMRLPRRMAPSEIAARARAVTLDGATIEIEPDRIAFPQQSFPNDPLYGSQWNLKLEGINLAPAWGTTTGAGSLVVAILDTGMLNHADLAGRFVAGYDFIGDTNRSNDGDGRESNALDPGDWVTAGESVAGPLAGCPVTNSRWHGTLMAGVIAANGNNGLKIAGINWNSRLLPVRVVGKCGGYTSDIADGMRWAAGLTVPGVPDNPNPAKVLNVSLAAQSPTCESAFASAIADVTTQKKATIVVSAGNASGLASQYAPGNCAGVITVGATDIRGGRPAYANTGDPIAVSAPGGEGTGPGSVLTLSDGGTTTAINDGAHTGTNGTSIAAAHVTGVASLLLSLRPNLTPAQVRDVLVTNARAFPTNAQAGGSFANCTTATCGAGIVDANAAILAANHPEAGKPGISAGREHTVALRTDGTLVAWGPNAWGQLGTGTTATQGFPATVNGIDGVVQVAAGGEHTLALRIDGSVWAWGRNDNGQLGIGAIDGIVHPAPLRVAGLSQVTSIAAGENHSAAITRDGKLWLWGFNGVGVLAIGTTVDQATPALVPSLPFVSSAALGNATTCATIGDASVRCWGFLNPLGGFGPSGSRLVDAPVTIANLNVLGTLAQGPDATHRVVLDSLGSLRGFGANENGQLGFPATASPQFASPGAIAPTGSFSAVAVGARHTIGLASNGQVYAVGDNAEGQLGRGNAPGLGTGGGYAETAQPVAGVRSAVRIAAGGDRAFAIRQDGSVVAWGAGHLGNGTELFSGETSAGRVAGIGGVDFLDLGATVAPADQFTSGSFPERSDVRTLSLQVSNPVTYLFGIALTLGTSGGDFSIGCAGPWVTSAQVLPGDSFCLRVTAAGTSGTTNIVTISDAFNFTSRSFSVTTPFGDVIPARTFLAPQVGLATAATATSGAVTISGVASTATVIPGPGMTTSAGCTGTFASGNVAVANGQSLCVRDATSATPGVTRQPAFDAGGVTTVFPVTTANPAYRVAPALAVSHQTVLGLRDDGALFGWGDGRTGQLGGAANGTKSEAPIALATLSLLKSVAVSRHHGAAAASDGTLWTWGRADFGQSGRNFIAERAVPPHPVPVASPLTAQKVAVGRYHTIALDGSGNVWAWGRNNDGQVGASCATQRCASPVQALAGAGIDAIAAAGNTSYAIDASGAVRCWGRCYGTFGYVFQSTPTVWSAISGVKAIASTTGGHWLALMLDGTVRAWGENALGQLGNNATLALPTIQSTPVTVSGLSGIVQVAAGGFDASDDRTLYLNSFSLALKGDGSLWAWGDNAFGQLGDGTLVSRLVPVQVAGVSAVTAIGAGNNFAAALKADGRVVAWGREQFGELGNGDGFDFTNPPLGSPVTVAGVGASGTLSLGVADNTVFAPQTDVPVSSVRTSNAIVGAWANGSAISIAGGGGQYSIGCTGTFTATASTIAAGASVCLRLTAPATLATTAATTLTIAGVPRAFTVTTIAGDTTPDVFRFAPAAARAPNTLVTSAPITITGINGPVTIAVSGGEYATPCGASPVFTAATGSISPSQTVCVRRLSAATADTVATATLTVGTRSADFHVITAVAPNFAVTPKVSAATGGAALRSDGTVFAWGFNLYGEVGDGTVQPRGSPVTLPTLSGVTSIDVARSHTLALRSDGSVWAWGDNASGRLGDGTQVASRVPLRVNGLPSPAIAVAGSYDHSVALLQNGQVWGWGSNAFGQLATGNTQSSSVPVQANAAGPFIGITTGLTITLALRSDGTVWCWGSCTDSGGANPQTTPVQVAPAVLTGIAEIAGSGEGYHYLARKGGTVLAWGSNTDGQLGLGNTSTAVYPPATVPGLANVARIAAGQVHSMALVDNAGARTVWAWGKNHFGQLGLGTSPTDASALSRNSPQRVATADGATTLDAGVYSSFAAMPDGNVLAWGIDYIGSLGNGSTSFISLQQPLPVRVLGPDGDGYLSTQFVDTSPDPFAFVARFGADPGAAVQSNTVRITGLSAASPISIAGGGTYSKDCNGTFTNAPDTIANNATVCVRVTAANFFETSASATLTVGSGSGARSSTFIVRTRRAQGSAPISPQVVLGNAHSLLLSAAGTVSGVGYNANGQLGNGTTLNTPTALRVPGLTGARRIAAGSYHSLAVNANGTVSAWGFNAVGQLGLGATDNARANPATVPGLSNVVAVAAGDYHSLALLQDGTVRAWGFNFYGQLGNGNTTNQSLPVAVSGLANVIAIAAGGQHSLALLADGTVLAWGANDSGQLGDNTAVSKASPVTIAGLTGVVALAAGTSHSLALRSNGTAWAWGANARGQLGIGTAVASPVPVAVAALGGNVGLVAAGGNHSLAVKAGGALFSWGANEGGQLGDGLAADRPIPYAVTVPAVATTIAAGARHSAALDATGKAYLWGDNFFGQVGNRSGNFSAHSASLNVLRGDSRISTGAGGTGSGTASSAGSGVLSLDNLAGGYSFGSVAVGQAASVPGSFQNASDTDDISGIGVSASGAGFTAGGTCNGTLAPGQSCGFTVDFSAGSSGTYAGQLRFDSDLVGAPEFRELEAVAVAAQAPALALAATSIAFPPTTVGSASAPIALAITNAGTATLSVSEANSTSPVFGAANGCAAVAPGGTCALQVTFAPLAVATASATLTIVSNGGNATVALLGTGIAANYDTTPDAFAFPSATNVATGSLVTSAAVAITGIAGPTPLSVQGGEYSVGCTGTFTGAAGTIANGQTVCVRQRASGTLATTVTTTLTVGGVAGTFSSTTTATAPSNPPRLGNISTRMQVLTGDNVLIGGFIIGGTQAKTVVVRARGPSLVPFGITNALANPTMQLFSGQTVIASSDDYGSAANLAALNASGFAPSNAQESAILITLGPGAYTAIVSGVGGTTGVGIIEVFEVDNPQAPLANISTRGQVLTGNDVMIGGFIIQGDAPQTVVIRARGPSLVPFGITNALADPVLQLFSGQAVIASNDDWQQAANAAAIQAAGFAPTNAREAAILITLPPGAYTAIVSGKNGGTGVGIIEVFAQ